MKVLILGATGLLGNALFRVLSKTGNLEVFGTIRKASSAKHFSTELANKLMIVQDLEETNLLVKLLNVLSPDVIINCTSLPRSEEQDPTKLLAIFSLLPRRLQHLCRAREIRLIQISSDGVFSGTRGKYTEDDLPDAKDPYGIAKILGEVEGPGVLTLRTSILGKELATQSGLLEWFLHQQTECRCYTHAMFSGFPTVILSQVIRDAVLPNERLEGIYHVAAEPISKFDLLTLVRQQYDKHTQMIPDDSVVIDRTLCADRFRLATGYNPPPWPEMIAMMHAFNYGLREN